MNTNFLYKIMDYYEEIEEIKWIDERLNRLGIEVRQSKQHKEMRYYIKLLKEELDMTTRFLSEDGEVKNK